MKLCPVNDFVQDSARKPKDKLCDWFCPSLPFSGESLSFTCSHALHIWSYYMDVTSSIPWP